MRIAYVTPYDATDIRSWSGTGYNIPKCLEAQGIEIEYIGPLKKQFAPLNIARYLVHKHITKKNDHPQRDPGFLRHYARQVERRLAEIDVDLVFGPGTLPLAYLRTDLPVVVWSDCTFASLEDYYAKFSNVSARTHRNGHEAEQRALDRCDLVIMSCQWAIDSVVNDYGIDPAKTTLVSLGANVPNDRTEDDIDALIEARSRDVCRLLFISVDWQRKGGPVALAVANDLHARGLPVELTVVGCEPESDGPLPDYVKALGFIAKNTPEGMARLQGLLGESHFFLLPTRADCTPIVYCEASSYGLPSLATRTGGVPSVIREGLNGRLFDLDAPAAAYGDAVTELFNDENAYRALARSTFREYRERLNWNVAGREVTRLLSGVLSAPKGGGAPPAAPAAAPNQPSASG